MKVVTVNVPDAILAEPLHALWSTVPETVIRLAPTPIAATAHLSPFMAMKSGHGSVSSVELKLVRNEKMLFARLRWANRAENGAIKDLNQFSDGAGIMFPLTPYANSMSMGDKENPVNIWLWKADKDKPFDVYAEGWGSSQRRSGAQSGLKCNAVYQNGDWHLVFQRSLRSRAIGEGYVSFTPRAKLGVAIAIWDGGNHERSAQKSFSGNWEPIEIES